MNEDLKEDPQIMKVLAENFESFDYDGKVGLATNIELELNLKPNSTPSKTTNIRYDRER